MEQTPSVGRVVHYAAYGTPGGEFPAGVCRAAIITEVGKLHESGINQVNADGILTNVSLCAINPTGLFFNVNVPYDPGKRPGTWHWPERV